jgi:short subunit dehydrogenase-like uncharacterized protein
MLAETLDIFSPLVHSFTCVLAKKKTITDNIFAEMITESALVILLERDALPLLSCNGALTPASGLGNVLVRRLCHTGSWRFESVVHT